MPTTLILSGLTSLYLLVSLIGVGRRWPRYTHLNHTISELGEVGAPDQRLVAFGIFLPVGLGLLAVAVATRPVTEPVSALALAIAIGYLVAAFFPCDPGSPMGGSSRQAIHNLGGAVEYIGGALALFRLGETHGQPFVGAGMLVGAGGIALSVTTRGRGLVQRIAETCLFGGLVLALWLHQP